MSHSTTYHDSQKKSKLWTRSFITITGAFSGNVLQAKLSIEWCRLDWVAMKRIISGYVVIFHSSRVLPTRVTDPHLRQFDGFINTYGRLYCNTSGIVRSNILYYSSVLKGYHLASTHWMQDLSPFWESSTLSATIEAPISFNHHVLLPSRRKLLRGLHSIGCTSRTGPTYSRGDSQYLWQ